MTCCDFPCCWKKKKPEDKSRTKNVIKAVGGEDFHDSRSACENFVNSRSLLRARGGKSVIWENDIGTHSEFSRGKSACV